MRRLPWAALALIAGTACANLVFVGCGSDSNPDIPAGDGGDENANVNPTPPPPDQDTGAPDADIGDVVLDGMRDPDATVICVDQGAACTTSAECCTNNCATQTDGGKACGAPTNLCKPSLSDGGLVACTLGIECCTGSCVNGSCSNIVCEANGLSCAKSSDCCSQNCVPQAGGGGKCQTLAANDAGTIATPCTTNSQCASGWCNNGACANPSFCVQNNDICTTNTECCGGLCNKQAGNTYGVCATTPSTAGGNCLPAGDLCGSGVDGGGGTNCDTSCCSKSCGPYITGAHVCEPPSGCKPTGELCKQNSDCCGAGTISDTKCQKANTTDEFGRCDNGKTCSPYGSTCQTKTATSCAGSANNCCEPHYLDGGTAGSSYCNSTGGGASPCCRQDALGIPRCLELAYDCAGGPPPNGTACSSSADCCGNPCVGGKCGTTCVGTGGACTTTSDCCPGLPCAIAPGSTTGICGGTVLADGGVTDAAPPGTSDSGTVTQDAGDGGSTTCSLYGQTCTQNADCCNGVPCDTTGTHTCHFP